MATETNPVWSVYDMLRSARLNVKYYERRLERLEHLNFIIELVLLASAPSSAIAGLWFWDTEIGKMIWQWFGVIAAIAVMLKPLLSLTKRIKELEGVLTGYRVLEFDLKEIRTLIEQKRKYDVGLQAEFKRALQRERALAGKTPETREAASVKNKCEEEVNRELPASSFFIPEESDNGTRPKTETAASSRTPG